MNRSWMSGIGSSGPLRTKPVMPPGKLGRKTAPGEQSLSERNRQPIRPHGARERALVAAAVDQERRDMVLQVLADAGERHLHGDLMRGKLRGSPMPGEHQQLRRVDRAAAQDHLALGCNNAPLAVVDIFDADRAVLLRAGHASRGSRSVPSDCAAPAPDAGRRSPRSRGGRGGWSSACGRSRPAGAVVVVVERDSPCPARRPDRHRPAGPDSAPCALQRTIAAAIRACPPSQLSWRRKYGSTCS